MKTSFNKKLSLNKRTVANLNVRELRAVKGGALTYAPGTTCNMNETCPDTCAASCCETNNTCTMTCPTIDTCNCYTFDSCDSQCRCFTDYC